MSSSSTSSSDTPSAIEADIVRTRAELKATVDALSERVAPKTLANDAVEEAKIAAEEIKRRVTGEVRRPDEPAPTKQGWIVLGTGAAVGLAVVTKILRKL